MLESPDRVRNLFFEIANEKGVDEAERVFNEVVRAARKIVPKAGRKAMPMPRAMLAKWFAKRMKSAKPKANNREIARQYLKNVERIRSPTESQIRSVVASITRKSQAKTSF
jgi:hypothetical protein